MNNGIESTAEKFDEFAALKQAIQLHNDGQYPAAESLYRQVLSHNPRNPDAQHLLGLLAHTAGRAGVAIDLIQQAIGINPHDPNYHHNLGIILESEGNIDAAIKCNERAIYLSPTHFGARYSLANEFRQTDQFERAVTQYERALEIQPDHTELLSNLGATLVALKKHDEAIAHYEHALRIDSANATVHSNLGKALAAIDNIEGATRAYERCLELSPGNTNALTNLAGLHLNERNLDTAAGYIRKCLSVDPGNRSALALEVIRRQMTGDMAGASDLLNFEQFVTTVDIDAPTEFESLQDFNSALVQHCCTHPTAQYEPTAKSTQRGQQTGELLKEPLGPIALLESKIRNAVSEFLDGIPANSDHPFFKYAPRQWRLSMWATILDRHGHQSPHIHPGGWLSGVYYAKLPSSLGQESSDNRAGCIEFGLPPENLDDGSAEPRIFEPREGRMYLFPSYFYHRTLPFDDDETRVSIAFDVMPLSDAEARLLEISKTDIEAMVDEADRLFSQGNYSHSEAICTRVLHADHLNHRALYRSAMIAYQNGRYADAEDFLRRAIRVKNTDAQYFVDFSMVMRMLQRHDEAADAIRRATELGSRDVATLLSAGAIYSDVGRFDEARQVYEEVIEQEPDSGTAYYSLSKIESPGPDDPLVKKMELAARDDRPDNKDLSNLYHALGRAYETGDDFDRAFQCFEKANSIRRKLVQFDIDAEKSNSKRIIKAFTPDLYEANKGSGNTSDLPIFVVGMPRSGTTLVEQILDSHPDIHGAGELNTLWKCTSHIGIYLPRGSALLDAVSEIKSEAWEILGNTYVETVRSFAPNARRIVDKLPFNYTLIGMIKLMMPNAHIIHCVRDPMDTCVSCYMTSFGQDRGFTNDLVELGETYQTYMNLMNHWKSLFRSEILDVQYETLIDDSEKQIRKIIDHVGVEWSDQCLEFHKNTRSVTTASYAQVRKPLYRSSIARWKKYEKHLQPLQRSLGLID